MSIKNEIVSTVFIFIKNIAYVGIQYKKNVSDFDWKKKEDNEEIISKPLKILGLLRRHKPVTKH